MINEVIIVEGKTDSQKLKKIYGENLITIETNGFGLTEQTIKKIKLLQKDKKIIIFTDPDGPGKKIREKLIDVLDGDVYNAFVNKNEIKENSNKIGIAEAEEEAIKKALDNLVTYNKQNNSLTWQEYLLNDFYVKSNRIKIAKHFNFSDELNAKSLFKWLNWMNLNVEQIEKILKG